MMDRTPPTPLAMIIGTAIISLMTGYMLGLASSLGLVPIPFMQPLAPPRGKAARKHESEVESSEEEIEISSVPLDHAPNWANGEAADLRDGLRQAEPLKTNEGKEGAGPAWEIDNEECKLVLVVRTDLGMTKGKIAAQCSHATLACYKALQQQKPRPSSSSPLLRRWERHGQAKVALQVKSEDELLELQAKAMSLGIVAEVIADAGRTQIAAGSHTVLGIGPAPKSVVDLVTGHLKLL